jgi:Protein of unknown function (DUF2442)
MSITANETTARATAARVTEDSLVVDLEDGRRISTPLAWYPRILHGTRQERTRFEITAFGIHWPDLDEDLSIAGMLAGRMSQEGPQSLARWLKGRSNRKAKRR